MTLEFGVEVEELPDADLVVGADGANSLLRRFGDFGTKVRPEGSKYVWFGTDHVFDAFTFAFRETEHGLFNAHAYPYDERMSTFIVECPEPVWRAAGLDELDEQESLAFCEQLFANELRGRELYSNRSLWLDFPKITNATWHAGNLVILGDAAHTAHFSIGSGTKLALDDSISLAAALARRRWDLAAAFVDYELEREPYVQRTQDAASESAAYFGRIASYSHLEPIQFAFQPADPERPDHACDARCARPAVHARAGRVVRRTRRLAAAGVLAVRAPRRAVREPLRARRELGRGQRGGAHVSGGRDPTRGQDPAPPEPCRSPRRDPAAEPGRRPAAGRRLARRGTDEASIRAVRCDSRPAGRGCRPRRVRRRGRERADAAVLEIDMAHGYLLGSYLSPLTNDEDDRLRFPLRVLEAVRAAWEGPLAVRLSVTDWHPRGNSVEDGIAIARALAEHGCDLIHVEAGQTIHDDRPQYRRGFLTALSDRVRNEARVPTLVGGHLTTLDEANTIVGAGRADLVLLDLPEIRHRAPSPT